MIKYEFWTEYYSSYESDWIPADPLKVTYDYSEMVDWLEFKAKKWAEDKMRLVYHEVTADQYIWPEEKP
jgi:hypothetical protein